MRTPSWRSFLLLVLFVAGCRDLGFPEPPEKGGVTGRVVGNDDAPLEGVSVELAPEFGEPLATVSDSTGAFSFTAVEPGRYVVRAAAQNRVEQQRSVTVVSRTTRDVGTFKLYSLQQPSDDDGTITGRVQVMSGGDPLGAEVTFREAATDQTVAILAVGASGDFVQRLPPGDWKITATHPLYTASQTITATLAPKAVLPLPMPLQLTINPGRVQGKVFLEIDRSAATLPAAGAVVTSDTSVSVTVDSMGNFDLGGLAGGLRRVRITLPGFHDPLAEHLVNVSPGMSSALSDVVLLLDRGNIQGEVEMGDNTPLVDVTASLAFTTPDAGTNPYAAQVSASGTRGTYLIRDVPVGQYAVRASRNNYIAATSSPLSVTSGATASADLLRLFRVQGDFEIDDGDTTNTPGFTRTANLTLRLSNAGSPAEYRVTESASALSSAPWQPFTATITPTSIPFVLAAGDGTHTVFIQYRDPQMNQSGVLSGSVVLDTIAPEPDAVGAVVIEGGAAFTRQNVRFSVSVGASDPRGSSVDNVSGLASVRLAASGMLDGQGRLNGSAKAYAPLLQFDRPPPTSDGLATVFAQFVDNAGNASSLIVSDQITVDTVPPTGTMTILRGAKASANGFTNDPSVRLQFSVSAEPDGGYVEVQRSNDDVLGLEGAALQRVTPTMQWGLTPNEGSRTIHYRLVDAAGNRAMAASQAIVLDLTPPTATLALAMAGAQNNLSVPLSVSASDPNGLSTVAALALSDDPTFTSASTTTFASLPSSPSFTLQAGDGLRSLNARFRDVAGNDAFAGLSFVVDTRVPAGSLVIEGSLADGTPSQVLTSSTSVTIRFVPDDAVEYVIGTETLSTCPTTGYQPLPTTLTLTNHPLTTSGEVRVCFRDAAKNTKLVGDTIVIDSSAPMGCSLSLTGVLANGASSGSTKTARPGITVTATGCGDATEIVLSEGALSCTPSATNAWSAFRATQAFTLTGVEGLATVRGCVRDAARNTALVNPASITLDTTPPTGGSVVINGDATWVNASQVTGGMTTFTVTGSASGAVRWAVGTTPGPTTFGALAAVALPVAVPTDGRYGVFAVFEDDMGNTTEGVINDTIFVDTTPPTVAGLTLRAFSTGAAGWSNTEAITLQVVPSLPDAISAQVVERLGTTSCTTSDFSTAVPQPVASSSVFALLPSEGPRRVCVRYRDAAGNNSVGGSPVGILEAAITLDKTAPTTPQIITANGFVRQARGTAQLVDIATPSTDALSFRSYQQLGGLFPDGGAISSWTDVSPTGPATRFTFRLDNDGSEFGSRNELRLRSTDSAGNASGESVVFITADTNAPPNVEAEQLWVDNASGLARAWFRRPVDAGVAGYHVYYSSNLDFLDVNGATFAAEGPSPVRLDDAPSVSVLSDGGVAAVQSVTLSGLANGAPTYVRIRAFDESGNEEGDGGSVWTNVDGGTRLPLQLQPDEVSANEIATLQIPGTATTVHRLAMNGDMLYVLATSAFCSLSTGTNLDYFLHAVDLNGLAAPVQNGSLDGPRTPPAVVSTFQMTGNTTGCDLSTSNADLVLEGTWAYVTTPTRLFILNISEPYAPTLYTSIDLTAASAGMNFRAQSMCSYGERLAIAGRSGSVGGTFMTLWNLAELYDRNSATLPTAADRYAAATLSTATIQPDSVFFTRDRLVSMGPSGPNNFLYRFDLGPSLAIVPAAPVSVGQLGNTVLPMAPLTRPPVSGNYVYLANPLSGLSSFRLNNVWTGSDPTVPLSSAWKADGPIDVLGHLAFAADPERRALRMTDITSPSQPRSVGVNSFGVSQADGVVAFGNYAVAVTGSTLRFYEVATPRALSSIGSEVLSGASIEVQGGFALTGGRVFDLQGSQLIAPTWPSTGSTSTTCFNGTAFGEALEFGGRGDGFVARNLESSMDRTTATGEAGGDTVTLAGARVTDVALHGNHLIVAEIRAAGLYLEVFDIRRARNRQGTFLSSSDTIGSVLVAPTASLPTAQVISNLTAKISVSHTRVAIGLDFNAVSPLISGAIGPHLYFVELKSLLDDDVANAPIVHGPVQINLVRQVVMANNTAYVATTLGLRAFDITPVMDSNPGTLLGTPTITNFVDGNPFAGVRVVGSTLFAMPAYTAAATPRPAGVYAVNVASTASPQVVGFYPYSPGDSSCTPAGDTVSRRVHGRITVAANRAYFTTPTGTIEVLRLE